MRPPQDAVPQRQLTYQLALAIDRAMETGDQREVEALIEANPRSAFSTHVRHNIGARRRRWLEAFQSRVRRASAKSR